MEQLLEKQVVELRGVGRFTITLCSNDSYLTDLDSAPFDGMWNVTEWRDCTLP